MGVQSGDDSPWRIHRRAPRRTSAAALRASKLIASRMATEVLLSFRARISLGSLPRQSIGGNVLARDRDKSFERFRSSVLALFASGKYRCTISQMASFPAKVLGSHLKKPGGIGSQWPQMESDFARATAG
jgi:hypothetical protein